MEQKFLIKNRPSGKGDLQIGLDITGDLEARIGRQGHLELYPAGSPQDIKLVYDQLKVWDRNGRMLAAAMTIDNAHRLVLKVADKNAVYPITVDPLNHLPDFSPNESQGGFLAIPNALFGYSICGNVDINMDGKADIVIGAPTYLNVTNFTTPLFGVTSVGAAFVFLGSSAALSTTPARVLQPTTVGGALFGFSVASAGDLDKDGFNDIVVGAPGDQVILSIGVLPVPTLVAIGKAYVYNTLTSFAPAAPQATPALTYSLAQGDFGPFLFSAPANPCFGFSVSGAGDFNHDGADDLMIGSPFFLPSGGSVKGLVDLYLSTASGTAITNATVPNKITPAVGQPDLFGFSLAKGNFNGDGFSDIVVGAPAQIGTIASSAYVFNGAGAPPTSTSSASVTLVSPSTGSLLAPTILGNLNTLFGFSVANAGDINGDGKDDVIIGAPLARDNTNILGTPAAGHAYIYYSNPLPLSGIQTTGFTTLSSPRSPALSGTVLGHLLFGYSVGSAGDANLDGKADVIVGEPGSSALGVGATLSALLGATGLSSSLASVLGGQAYLFLGNGATAATTPAWTDRETSVLAVANLLGASVGNLGDVNGDGQPDFFVSAPSGVLSISANVVVSGSAPLTVQITSGGNGIANIYFASSTILPVVLLDFTGRKDNGSSVLDWSTAQEENSDRFEIERSADNSSFTKIGQVTSAHNSTQVTPYTFTDAAPLPGNNYYRLRMVDLDGKYTYSKVVVLNFASGLHVITAYPNPAQGSFQLKFSNMNAGRYDMSLINATGQTVMTKSIQVGNAASYIETVGLPSGIAGGTYVIRVVDPQQYTFLTRVVVQ